MKKLIITAITLLQLIYVFAQTNTLDAKKVIVRDSLILTGKKISGVVTDSSLVGDNTKIAGLQALKEYISNRLTTAVITETDPSVGSHIKAISTTDISSWDAAFNFTNNFNIANYFPTLDTRYLQISNFNWDNLSNKPFNYSTTYALSNDIRDSLTARYTKSQSDARYLQSYTETDPIYTGSSWYSTTNNSSNWNSAYSWGNHATAGYASASALNNYLPLSGGTLTGALNGTSANFSNSVTANSLLVTDYIGINLSGNYIRWNSPANNNADYYLGLSGTMNGAFQLYDNSNSSFVFYTDKSGSNFTFYRNLITTGNLTANNTFFGSNGSNYVGTIYAYNGAQTRFNVNSGASVNYNGFLIESNYGNGGGLPSWAIDLGGFDAITYGIGDVFAIRRKPNSGSYSTFFSINNLGNATHSGALSINGDVAGVSLFIGSSAIRYLSSSGNFIDFNAGGAASTVLFRNGNSFYEFLGVNSNNQVTLTSIDGTGTRTNPHTVLTINALNYNQPFDGFGAALNFSSTHYNGLNYVGARIRSQLNDNSIVTYGNSLVFDVTPTRGAALTTGMILTYDGNLLIGTTNNNGYRLNVVGAATFSSSVTATNFIGNWQGYTPSSFALASHTHSTSDITNLSSYTGFDSRYARLTGANFSGPITGPSANFEGLLVDGNAEITDYLTVNSVTANSFIKSGGTASQILAANGSVITAGSGITISGGQISANSASGTFSLYPGVGLQLYGGAIETQNLSSSPVYYIKEKLAKESSYQTTNTTTANIATYNPSINEQGVLHVIVSGFDGTTSDQITYTAKVYYYKSASNTVNIYVSPVGQEEYLWGNFSSGFNVDVTTSGGEIIIQANGTGNGCYWTAYTRAYPNYPAN